MRKKIFFKGGKKEGTPRGSLEMTISVCHEVSRWGQWEEYKGEGVEDGGGRVDSLVTHGIGR